MPAPGGLFWSSPRESTATIMTAPPRNSEKKAVAGLTHGWGTAHQLVYVSVLGGQTWELASYFHLEELVGGEMAGAYIVGSTSMMAS